MSATVISLTNYRNQHANTSVKEVSSVPMSLVKVVKQKAKKEENLGAVWETFQFPEDIVAYDDGGYELMPEDRTRMSAFLRAYGYRIEDAVTIDALLNVWETIHTLYYVKASVYASLGRVSGSAEMKAYIKAVVIGDTEATAKFVGTSKEKPGLHLV